MNSFEASLLIELFANIENNFTDNYDNYRFGRRKTEKKTLKKRIKNFLVKIARIKESNLIINKYIESTELIKPYFTDFQRLYQVFADEYSKVLLIKLICYRILGEKKIRLPLGEFNYHTITKKIETLKLNDKSIAIESNGGKNYKLDFYNLYNIGYPICIYCNLPTLFSSFLVLQYEYKQGNVVIRPEKNDVVLDCGACWGDTALLFSNQVGEGGRVFSFEINPVNMEVFRINNDLNSNLKDRITLIQNAVSEVSDLELFYDNIGPGSKINKNNTNSTMPVKTISIDTFIIRNQIVKVDFIKMDIEGSELSALKGAVETLTKHKPKLAISIYHSLDDFVKIPEFINSLNIGYKLYIKHSTIHIEETILFAIIDTNK